MAHSPPSTVQLPAPDSDIGLEGRRVLFEVLTRLTGRDDRVRVGRYILGTRLGQGGCGAVFTAHDPELDRDVAIKVVLPSTPAFAEASERLVREAQALAKLGHPNIVEVFDVGVDELQLGEKRKARPGVFIVMERIDGPTLADWQVEPSRTTAEIVDAYLQAAQGLAAAHEVGVIHRDFKPSNVMRTRDGRVKVLDFGLAREDVALVSDSEVTSATSSQDSLTRTGMVMGTPRYMAPEQHAGRLATAAADQYALCVALWEALAGEPVFRGATLDELGHVKRRGPPARPRRGRMTGAIYEVIVRGLQPNPSLRFENLAALAQALQRAAESRRNRIVPVVLGVGALAAVAIAFAPARMPELCDAAEPGFVTDGFVRAASWPSGTSLRLDRFAARWTAARDATCDASVDVPPEERREHAACLERALAYFDTARSELGDPSAAAFAKRKLWGMPSPQRCVGDDPADYFARTPEDEAEIEAIVTRMRELYGRPGDPAVVAAFVDASMPRLEALHDHGIAAGLLLLQARTTHQAGDYEAAARLDLEAAWRCESADDPLLATEHLAHAAGSLISAGAPPAEVDRLVTTAIEMSRAAGDPPELVVEVASVQAYSADTRGDFGRALQLGYEAIAAAESIASPEIDQQLARALGTAATAHIHRGEGYLALPLYRRAVPLIRADNPGSKEGLAFTYRGMAYSAFETGQPDLALQYALRSVGLLGEIYPGDHPGLLYDVAFYGYLLAERGQVDEGIAHMEHARRGLLAVPRSHELPTVLANLTTAWVATGRHEQAERDGKLAIERFVEAFGPGAPQASSLYLTLADARLDRNDVPGAKAALAAADAAMPKAIGGGGALVRARLAFAEGDHASAWTHALSAIGSVGPHRLDGSSVGGRGTALALLARIADARGDRAEADVLAAFAEPLLAGGGAIHRARAAELAKWRARRQERG